MSSDSSFYGDGAKIIHASVDISERSLLIPESEVDIDEYYETSRCVEWLTSHMSITKVALQFPDDLLRDSVAVIGRLQACLPQLTFFILADTSYGSCCVDYVAAQHYKANVLIHYGASCLSPTSNIPVLWVFGRVSIDLADCCEHLTKAINQQRPCVLMFDVRYDYIIDSLFVKLRESSMNTSNLARSHLRTCANLEINEATAENAQRVEVNGRSWCLLDSSHTIKDYDVIYIGGEGRTLTNLMMVMNSSKFYTYNPPSKVFRLETMQVNKSLMRRFYLIEKAKDANIIGIVIGTLAVSNYLLIHNRLKELIKKAGKKSYTIVVGKLNTAKLANFMEVDMFVLVACAENTLIDSSEFYKPVVTPYEMELACNTEREWTGGYITDFRSLLPEGDNYQPLPDTMQVQADMSLVTGAMRNIGVSEEPTGSSQLALRESNRSLVAVSAAKSAGEYLSARTWTGLEQELGETAVQKAKQGQTGIAMGYKNEPT